MLAPTAPKDPEKARSYFYIMKQKNIFGSVQPDGSIMQFLYQSDGRLESSATVVGDVTDQHMLELMGTVEGLKKLVHSIGISVESENPTEEYEFIFQMYGKEDLYGGGTNLVASLRGDGNEARIYLEDVQWREDDNIPGQIKINMPVAEKMASLNVRFYLNDGYEAPVQQEDLAVDRDADSYRKIIEKSLVSLGNTKRLYSAIDKARKGEKVSIAFLGGSITQGAGATPINTECYAYKAYEHFKEVAKAGENVKFIKAGVGGTPSELGMIRFDRDVLRDGEKPDVVIVEFAVNDAGDETEGDCFESLVRKILGLWWKPAVILLFSIFADDFNLQDRLIPIGNRYDLPMVSLKDSLLEQFYDKKHRVISKNQYFYDCFHPTNLGHTVMADCLRYLFESAGDFEDYNPKLDENPIIGDTFDSVYLMDKKDVDAEVFIDEGDFIYTDTVLQGAEKDLSLELTWQFPYNWMYDGKKGSRESFKMKLTCKSLVLVFKDSGEVDAAKATVFVDGKKVRVADPYINRWLHVNPIIIIDEPYSMEHQVEIKVNEEDVEKKFTILGFGIVK